MAKTKAEIDKNYEERHKEERKARSLVWGTSVPHKFAEEINAFLKETGYTKVRLIEVGYKCLKEQATKDVEDRQPKQYTLPCRAGRISEVPRL